MTPTHALEREEPWDLRPEAPGGRAGARLQGPGATAESWSPQQPGGHVPEGLPGEGLEGLAVQKIPVENPRVAASDGQMPAGFCDSGNTSPVGLAGSKSGRGDGCWEQVLAPTLSPDTAPTTAPREQGLLCRLPCTQTLLGEDALSETVLLPAGTPPTVSAPSLRCGWPGPSTVSLTG